MCHINLFCHSRATPCLVQDCCVKESLGQSQGCGSLVLVKVKYNLRSSIHLRWLYGQEFILQLPLYTNSKSVCCIRHVSTVSCCCQRLIQNPCIILQLWAVVAKSPIWKTEVVLALLLVMSVYVC